ncbi:MAG TPA: PilZ domain-containing protein [Allosphingosinicella sp.]|nr:PilZ domain-containing protein [Allosphingosinicella sp.]
MDFDRRKRPRTGLDLSTRVHPNEWCSVEARLIDFSADGFRGEGELFLRVGSFLSVEVAGIGRVQAKVIWSQDGQFGAKFIAPIDLRHCDWADGCNGVDSPVPEGGSRAAAEALALFRARFARYGS